MDPIIGAGIVSGAGDLLGGIIGSHGQANANQVSRQIAAKQMRFQKQMSDTAYQRAVRDMRAAGLNPALAYQQGGASSPSGSSANVENELGPLGAGVQSAGSVALAVQQQKANIAQVQAQTEKTVSERRAIDISTKLGLQKWTVAQLMGQVDVLGGQYRMTGAQSDQIEQAIRFNADMQPTRLAQLKAEASRSGFEAGRSRVGLAFDQKSFGLRLRQLAEELRRTGNSADAIKVSSVSEALGLQEAVNQSDAAKSWFSRKVAPHLNNAEQVLRILKGILSSPFSSKDD